MTEVAFAVAFMATPLLLLPAVLRRHSAAFRPSVFALFVVPLVGTVTYCMLSPQLGLAAVVVGYPTALVSLGFWAALLAATGTSVLARAASVAQARAVSRVLCASASGALVGAGFMVLYSLVVSSNIDVSTVQRCGVAGLTGGAFAGGFAGYDLSSVR